jgi:hypothetical protein
MLETEKTKAEPDATNDETDDGEALSMVHFSAIFACGSFQPPILTEHLPQLITTASLAYPELPQTRLLELPKGSEERLCQGLFHWHLRRCTLLEVSH